MTDQPRRPVFFWLVLLICVVYAGFFAFTVYAVARYYGVEKAPGWSATRNDGTAWFVSDVDPAGPAAGRIQLGDRLLAINGDERRAVFGSFQWVFVDGGKSYRVDLDRSGERASLTLPMPVVPGQRLTPIFALVGLAFFICLHPRPPDLYWWHGGNGAPGRTFACSLRVRSTALSTLSYGSKVCGRPPG